MRACTVTTVFERFTHDARRVLVVANHEATHRGDPSIEPVHCLLGLEAVDGSGRAALHAAGVDRDRILAWIGPGASDAGPASLPFSAASKHLLERALREALALDHHFIASGHILLACLGARDDVAAWLLDAGVDIERVEAELARTPEASRSRGPRRRPRRTGRVVEAPTPHEQAKAAAAGTSGDETAQRLLALAAEEGSAAQQALQSLGIDASTIADAIRKVAADNASADGPVVLELADGARFAVPAGDLARELRSLLRALVEHGIVTGALEEDGTFVAQVPGLHDTVVRSATAWLEAAAETAG